MKLLIFSWIFWFYSCPIGASTSNWQEFQRNRNLTEEMGLLFAALGLGFLFWFTAFVFEKKLSNLDKYVIKLINLIQQIKLPKPKIFKIFKK